MGLDPSRPFPEPLNKGLAFIVDLEETDAFGRAGNKAIVQAPRSLPRVIKVPVTDVGAVRFCSVVEHYRSLRGRAVPGNAR